MRCDDKISYKSKNEALKHKRLAFFKRAIVYQCQKCFSWHLTTQLKENKVIHNLTFRKK